MSTASPVDIAVNPNDDTQRYILWGNGRVDNIGGAPAITSHPDWTSSLRLPVAVALHITDWTTGQGYVLDLFGAFHSINGAPTMGNGGVLSGVPYVEHVRTYVDWSWNPDGSGQGVVLDVYGKIYPFGGAPAPSSPGPMFTVPLAKRLVMQWTPDVRAYVLDAYGGVHKFYNAVAAAGIPYWPGWDAARDLVITDWTTPSGYVLDLWGGVHNIGSAPESFGTPYKKGVDVGRRLYVLSASNPTRFWVVWARGEQFEWVSSTPPTVVAGGAGTPSPAATVTTTTRPTLSWSYTDAQNDEQAAWELYLYTSAFVAGHDMTDPAAWADSALAALSGSDRAQRGAVADVDLSNGGYTFYVRAQDTAGQWSAWSSLAWTQNVPVPVAPTGLTATPDADSYSVALSVTATTGGSADTVRFERSDDSGTTWTAVRGADTVPLAATTTATDYDVPLAGRVRTYRATAYADSPRVASSPSNSVTASITAKHHVLTAVNDATLGGRILPQGQISWSRTARAGVFQPLGADYPVVVSDGTPKARKTTLTILALSEDVWNVLDGLIQAQSTLVYRTPRGEVIYCRLVGDFDQTAMPGAATNHEDTVTLPLVEVAPPKTVVSTSPPLAGS